MTRPLSHFDAILEGDWIGQYEIIERLRSGGMATLYLGRRHGAAGLKRLAAIKVIHPHLSYDERFVRMFIDEARISAEISHPNVVHVEELGRDRGLPFLVMEFIDGCSISQLLRQLKTRGQPLPLAMACRVVIEAAGGLHGAHETRGADGNALEIVHRDVSCSNILISKTGHVKLIDFGIALARGRLAKTKTGFSLKGKLRYMSPEQANRKKIDRRSDVYSLGVVFWELLTNRALHEEADEIALLKRLQSSTVEPPSKYNPSVPPEIDAIVIKMLATDPRVRPQTAWDLRRELIVAIPDALTVDSAELGKIIDGVTSDLREKERSAASRNALDGQPSFTTRLTHSLPGGFQRKNPNDHELIDRIVAKPSFVQTVRSKFSIHQIVLASAALVLFGLLSGRVLFGGNSNSEGAATQPSQRAAPVAAPETLQIEPKLAGPETAKTEQLEGIEGTTGSPLGTERSAAFQTDATGGNKPAKSAQAPKSRARGEGKLSANQRASRRDAKTGARARPIAKRKIVVDGTRIANNPFGDDDQSNSSSKKRSSKTRSSKTRSSKTRSSKTPGRARSKVGDTPIVTDFED